MAGKDIDDLFDDFLKTTIIGGNSLFSTLSSIFSREPLEEIKSNFLKDEHKTNFKDSIITQFQDASDNAKELFTHLIWLRYLPILDVSTKTKCGMISLLNASYAQGQEAKFCDGIATYGMKRKELYEDMEYLCSVFTELKKQTTGATGATVTTNEIKAQIVEIITQTLQTNKSKCAIRSMLLYLCHPSEYEPIASFSHKILIVKKLYPIYVGRAKLIANTNYGQLTNLNGKQYQVWKPRNKIEENFSDFDKIDNYISRIREILKKEGKWNDTERFYSKEIEEQWRDRYVAGGYEILTQYHKQIILYGAPGTGKTYSAKEIIKECIGAFNDTETINDYRFKSQLNKNGKEILAKGVAKKDVIWDIVQFNQSYSYEDFIEGLRPQQNGNGLEIVDGIFKRIANIARDNSDKNFILIIDEINRGKIDKIFGELLYLLEYRDESVKLHYSGKDFSIPKNLYIIGTMNTADKSLALLDVALRRRFWFVRCEPQEDVLMEQFSISGKLDIIGAENAENVKKIAIKLFIYLNKEILNDANFGSDSSEIKIGHSYFLELLRKDDEQNDIEPTFSDLKNIWFYSIIPFLEEYCGFDKQRLSDLFITSSIKIDLSKKDKFTFEELFKALKGIK